MNFCLGKETQRAFIQLLQVYVKYKSELLYPHIEKQIIWKKITDEIREKCSINCDELQCRNKIEELRCVYEQMKKEKNISLELVDFLTEAKKAFESTVQAESIDEFLKINICSILHTASEETVCGIIDALKYVGLESLADLQFVKEEDLLFALKPIQRRKLIKAWSEPETMRGIDSLIKHLAATTVEESEKDKEVSLAGQALKLDTEADAEKVVNAINSCPVILAAELPICESKKKRIWIWKRRLALLRLYAMHKRQFSDPNTDDQNVWKKIANHLTSELRFKYCNASNCKNQIHDMKCEYEKKMKMLSKVDFDITKSIHQQKQAIFLDEAKCAFETLENPVSFSEKPRSKNEHEMSRKSLVKWTLNGGDRITLLQIYTKYKTKLAAPDVDENQEFWGKIAKKATEKCSLYCGEFRCRYEINHMRKKYQLFKNKENRPYFFEEAKKAFEIAECPGQNEQVHFLKKEIRQD